MAEELTPVQVTAWNSSSGIPCWTVTYERPDGTKHQHAFPQSTLEWRVAEYGLDSIDEALDIVLHEPWKIDPVDPLLARDDAAVRQGMVMRTRGAAVDYEAIRLHNADSIADARTAHRLRIADAKTRVHITAPKGKANPLDTIRASHGVTTEGVRLKGQIVEQTRRSYRGEPVAPQPAFTFAPETPKETTRA